MMEKYRIADQLLESQTSRGNKRGLEKINSVIVHTTGYGKGLARLKDKHSGDLNIVGEEYAKRMANISRYKGHFLIDHTGQIYQFLSLDEVGWHTGSNKKRKLKDDEPANWWKARWTNFKRPTDLPSWQGSSPNTASVGIDLLAHGNGALTKGYTEKQYVSLAKLIEALCEDLNIPPERKYIVGHEDVDPISRGTKTSGWDPGKFDWERLMVDLQPEIIEDQPQSWDDFKIDLPPVEKPPVSRTGTPYMPMPKTVGGSFFKLLKKILSILRG
jgi:N-acetyl-anhydromuramyl-L-alanine amidase AmpD